MNKVLSFLNEAVSDAKAVWRLLLIKTANFLKKVKLLPPFDEDREDAEFEARYKKHNDEFNAMMKREHPFLYAFKKAEPFIMWFGFNIYLWTVC